ncbi:hypothetical protein E2562_035316 [Oryza meyeriana var. granulata]|uniref:Uncharacterized protein n=1 Tax=Oryza meyeriana var. granulata TaxID=110450 RepID=A0A6G1CKZ8_9ORYZ|nr:hypothetical protein E2562_035316 [Oryza meyeriana var. granulata]
MKPTSACHDLLEAIHGGASPPLPFPEAKPPEISPATGSVAVAAAAGAKSQAELLKQEGNAFFKKDRIRAAIDAYTEVRPTHAFTAKLFQRFGVGA